MWSSDDNDQRKSKIIFGQAKAKVNIDMEDIFHDQIIRGSIKIPRF